jgi:sugar/nucleoside kinase (ribokinase family)
VKTPDFLVIGHVAKDLVGNGYRLGGTAAYAAVTARNLGRRVGVVTSAGPDLELTHLLSGIQVLCVPSPISTTFLNAYTGGQRHQYIHAIAESIPSDAVPLEWRSCPVVHIGPIAHELDEKIIDLFPASLLGLTPQGWLRQWDADGRVAPHRWEEAYQLLPRVDAVIVSEEDLSGEAGALRAQLHLAPIAIVTQGAKGATLHERGKGHYSPPRDTRMVDATGAGDVFAAAFLVRLAETEDSWESCRFANVAASLSVEKTGVDSAPQRAEIEKLAAAAP